MVSVWPAAASSPAEDGARLGHVAEREVLLDGQRVDVALQPPAAV
jgi:hypothetical protein